MLPVNAASTFLYRSRVLSLTSAEIRSWGGGRTQKPPQDDLWLQFQMFEQESQPGSHPSPSPLLQEESSGCRNRENAEPEAEYQRYVKRCYNRTAKTTGLKERRGSGRGDHCFLRLLTASPAGIKDSIYGFLCQGSVSKK